MREVSRSTEGLRLRQARKQFGVGIVLEDVQAQQAVTQRVRITSPPSPSTKGAACVDQGSGWNTARRELTAVKHSHW
jgi:hypothetical protein